MLYLNGKLVLNNTFPNGEIIPQVTAPILRENTVYLNYRSSQDLINLMFLKDFLDRKNVVVKLFISYLPYGRMDRIKGDDQMFTLKSLTNFINNLFFDEVYVLDAHSDVSIALLDNCKEITVSHDLIDEAVLHTSGNFHIVLPDAGAAKRYSPKYENVLVARKDRDFMTGVIKEIALDTHVENPDTAIIIDDICSYGGTFVGLSHILKAKGFKKIYLCVTHAENSIFKGQLFDHIDHVFTTDSLLSEANNWENQNYKNQLTVFPVTDLIASLNTTEDN